MVDEDPLRTRRDANLPVAVDLSASGFEAAEEIGHGGFGVVYRCTQAALDRTVAVKVLTAELDEDNKTRFLREQRAMGRLTGHPNIVTVLQVGVTASGRPYLVMPYHPLDSLDAWIRRQGPMSVETVLWIGVKIAGALESAHRLGIVHRDVKPGNILLTDYGEPALTDFGIARIAGGFETATGIVTASPAFTAPEVLGGETATRAADVYGLGATLFCALTGHAAFERRSGEQVVAQFLRITSQPVPDLRDSGIPDDLSAVVESAMDRDPQARPTAEAFGEVIRQVQGDHGYQVGNMALYGTHAAAPGPKAHTPPPGGAAIPQSADIRGSTRQLPLELTSFVDRRTETAEIKNLLSVSRVVTLAGIGGVGKTRLALRVASNARRVVTDGVWMIELADVRDSALLSNVVAAAMGLRDDSDRSMRQGLVDFLRPREALLVLDNGEQVVQALAGLVEELLVRCPRVRILVTSREPLDVAGEAVLRVQPLAVPSPAERPVLRGLPKYDAVSLFVDRAAAVVRGFEVTEKNKAAVVGICSRLDGLPLAIELAAARIRAMSPEQILERLSDRYALLTRGSRTAPRRQQTLWWCIDWSYQLCTPVEQRLWARLWVFAGGFELDAAEQVCTPDIAHENLLDALSGLVDKSIVNRDEVDGVVRFRMLETVRDYGREQLRDSGEDRDLRRRHRDWCQELVLNSVADWISDRQPDWLVRLEREQPNLRGALEFSLSEDSAGSADTGLRIANALFGFWSFRGLYGEGRRWLDRALAHPDAGSISDRVKALEASIFMATAQRDLRSAASLLEQARALAEQDPTPMNQALIAYADGTMALYRDEPARAVSCFEQAIVAFSSDRRGYLYISALMLLGWAYAAQGDIPRAIQYHEEMLSITAESGESLYRSTALCGLGIAAWLQGERSHAQQLLYESLRVNQRMHSPVVSALDLEALAWTFAADDGERTAVLMGAAERLLRSSASGFSVFPKLAHVHDEYERTVRRALGERRFDAAFRRGQAMGDDAAVTYALGEPPTATAPASQLRLTKRERQVADLIAQGLTNKQIAAKLVISLRTAEGHVEHILNKLGFTSRAQIAAWIADEAQRGSS
ncbi:protein kinase [Streptomyces gardneri]|uniref:protein kinase domain-containing protein n=1 Tax=Nocardia abscessus TaxID=120957 RepID=UPI0018941C5C|nr:protein kinase [Nocardia abscessus]MBF6166968.1 protein kinase [Streptomyces gardneri]MBF6221714.1 protein kinase [Nocardia abscessus]MBF6475340.1 protein kinase [Nocardia abscessus]